MSEKQVLIWVKFREEKQLQRILRFLRKHGFEFEVHDVKEHLIISEEEYEALKHG